MVCLPYNILVTPIYHLIADMPPFFSRAEGRCVSYHLHGTHTTPFTPHTYHTTTRVSAIPLLAGDVTFFGPTTSACCSLALCCRRCTRTRHPIAVRALQDTTARWLHAPLRWASNALLRSCLQPPLPRRKADAALARTRGRAAADIAADHALRAPCHTTRRKHRALILRMVLL